MCIDNGSFYIKFQCFKLRLAFVRPISRQSLKLNLTSSSPAQCSVFLASTKQIGNYESYKYNIQTPKLQVSKPVNDQ